MSEMWNTFKKNVFPGESGGDYNALWDYQNLPGGIYSDVKITDMSINQALKFAAPGGESNYGDFVALTNDGEFSTPMGAFQVVGRTLLDARNNLGLRGTEKMTPEIQDKIGQWILKTQGSGAWPGYEGPEIKPGDFKMEPEQENEAEEQAAQPGIMSFLQNAKQAVQKKTSNPDFWDRLAIGANAMTLEPDPNFAAAIRDRMTDRRAQAALTGQSNRSVEMLRAMNGPDGKPDPAAQQVADAIEANPKMANALLTNFFQTRSAGKSLQGTRSFPGGLEMQTFKDGRTVFKQNGVVLTSSAEIEGAYRAVSEYQAETAGGVQGAKTAAQLQGERDFEIRIGRRKTATAFNQAKIIINRMMANLDGMEDALGKGVGLINLGGLTQGTISDEGIEFITQHEMLAGQIFLDAFQELKGGGPVTEIEGTKATKAKASMDRALTPKAYRIALRQYLEALQRGVAGYDAEINKQPVLMDETPIYWGDAAPVPQL